jgi:hypothetical protein
VNGELSRSFHRLHDGEACAVYPGRRWSLWELLMEKFDAGRLFISITGVSNMGHGLNMDNGLAIPMGNYQEVCQSIDYICISLNKLTLTTTLTSANTLKDILKKEVKLNAQSSDAAIPGLFALFEPLVFGRFMHFSAELVGRFKDEMSSKIVFSISQRNSGYLDSETPLFGDEVFDAFPSANDDIAEAGACLALGRGTACVMHLMRASEVGLSALGKTIGVSKQNDWGSYLREIEKELTRRAKTSGSRSVDEQFYSESAASFDHLKRAWRNPTMHVDRSYSPERGEEIFSAVKSLMRLLATRVVE